MSPIPGEPLDRKDPELVTKDGRTIAAVINFAGLLLNRSIIFSEFVTVLFQRIPIIR